jgi:exosortase N
MITLSANTAMIGGLKLKTGILLLVYAGIWISVLRDYQPLTSLAFVLALWTLPFTVRREVPKRLPVGWMASAILCIVLSFLVPVKTLLYLSIGWALFLLLPLFSYRPTFLSIAVWVVACPAFQYVTNVFSFPIRLQLTEWAGQLLALWFKGITTRGNVIYYGHHEFSVDPACMGLNMLVTSLLLGVMTFGYFQLRLRKRVVWGWALLFLIAILGCNVISNLFRIMLLVQFSVWPGTLLHDLVGLACLALYVLLPSVLLARLVVNRLGVAYQKVSDPVPSPAPRLLLHYLLAALTVLSSWRVLSVDTYADFKGAATGKVPGYNITSYAPGILKLENDHALVYVKYVRGFYDTDHHPSLCWKGSGYEFQQVEPTTVGGTPVYTALLVNGPGKLYTAWWYGNGHSNTIDQFRWRYDRLKGANNYAVINVTTADQASLHAEVEKIIRHKVLNPLLKNQ